MAPITCKSLAARVSVPFRGFRGLQDSKASETLSESGRKFQSPSGVLGVCRARLIIFPDPESVWGFSPLPGF